MADYTIQRGDSLWALARSHGTTIQALARANGITDVNHLVAGRTLKMPGDAFVRSTSPKPAAVPPAKPDTRPAAPATPPRAMPLKPTVPSLPSPTVGAIAAKPWAQAFGEDDVDLLARALSAESRGLLSQFVATGNPMYRDSVLAAGYVIARTAAQRKTSILGLLGDQPFFLASWGNGEGAGNAGNFQQFFLPESQLAHWSELKAIAREALSGVDPTGVDPDHFYDDSIAAPKWAQQADASLQLGRMIFVRSQAKPAAVTR